MIQENINQTILLGKPCVKNMISSSKKRLDDFTEALLWVVQDCTTVAGPLKKKSDSPKKDGIERSDDFAGGPSSLTFIRTLFLNLIVGGELASSDKDSRPQ